MAGRRPCCCIGATLLGREGDGFSLAEKFDKKPEAATPATPAPGDPQMGAALRSVYQKAVEEAIPDEMLDLLSKLD